MDDGEPHLCVILMSCPKGKRCFPFKACLIWTISSDNQRPGLIHLRWVRPPCCPYGTGKWCLTNSGVQHLDLFCRLLFAHPQITRTESSIRGEGHTLHSREAVLMYIRDVRCAYFFLDSSFTSPPPPWNVFSNLSMMCCLKGAAVTQVQLLLSEAGFSVYTPGPVSLNPGLRGVGPEQKEWVTQFFRRQRVVGNNNLIRLLKGELRVKNCFIDPY